MNYSTIASRLFRRVFPLFIGIFIMSNSFSQSKYMPGYVIKMDGDTLKGYIDYRNWDINPDNIFFKEDLSSEKVNYTPLNILGFGVGAEKYVGAIAQTEISPSNINNITVDAELHIIIDTSFLQTLVQGEKCLYFKKNSFGNEQFYVKIDGKYELLTYKKYLVNRSGLEVVAENKKYLGQLSYYLSGCPDVQTKLNDTKYSIESLKAIFFMYYTCKNVEFEYAKLKEKVNVEFGVLAGLSITNIAFKSAEFDYLVKADFSQSANPAFAVFADVIIPRNQGRLSIYNELGYTAYKIDGRHDDVINPDVYTYNFTTMEYAYIKLSNMLRYRYSVGDLDLFANAGISNGYAISETNYRRTESKVYVTERLEEGFAVDDARLYEQDYILGLGAKYKNFLLEVRKQGGNGISNFVNMGSPVSRYYFMLGYSF